MTSIDVTSIDFQPYDERWLEQIAGLHRRIADMPVEVLEQVFRWKHGANPATSRPLAVVALEKGEVVATRSAYGLSLAVSGRTPPVRAACFGGT